MAAAPGIDKATALNNNQLAFHNSVLQFGEDFYYYITYNLEALRRQLIYCVLIRVPPRIAGAITEIDQVEGRGAGLRTHMIILNRAVAGRKCAEYPSGQQPYPKQAFEAMQSSSIHASRRDRHRRSYLR